MNNETENVNVIEGLSLNGTVTQRSKKFIGEEKKEVVTYLISTNHGYYFLDEFLPQSYFRIGDQISVPVSCRPFARKDNRLGVSFTIRKDSGITLSGEGF